MRWSIGPITGGVQPIYLFHWWGDVWQIGDGEDYLVMLFVKLVLFAIVTAVGLALLAFWLDWKLIQWKPTVGIPITVVIVALFAISAASGGG